MRDRFCSVDTIQGILGCCLSMQGLVTFCLIDRGVEGDGVVLSSGATSLAIRVGLRVNGASGYCAFP